MKKEALYWQPLEEEKVKCLLCPRECVIRPGKKGFCRVKTNQGGTLYAQGYGQTISLSMDPIEKKPLYHFYPGSYILSAGPNGCNLACIFCQNWQISQTDVPTKYVSPEKLKDWAIHHQSIGVAFTYSEPLIWFEYILDVARLGKRQGLKTVLVTNGIINPEPFEDLLSWVDAMNVDLKSMRDEFYKKLCRGPFRDTVLHTIKRGHEAGIHIEVTNLIIPGYNDSQAEIQELIDWIASVSPQIPLHFSRFFPHYQLRDVPPTPTETLAMAREMALKKLNYVYVGNVWNREWDTTYCPKCGEALIIREGYTLPRINLKDKSCPRCGESIPVIL
jgi:pyruvate formate lyase activating enzyme